MYDICFNSNLVMLHKLANGVQMVGLTLPYQSQLVEQAFTDNSFTFPHSRRLSVWVWDLIALFSGLRNLTCINWSTSSVQNDTQQIMVSRLVIYGDSM